MEYIFTGWCKDVDTNTDKVWSAIKLRDNGYEGDYLTVWGRRGAKLQGKVLKDQTEWDMHKLCASKEKKGYNRLSPEEFNNVYPDFQQDLEQSAFWAALSI